MPLELVSRGSWQEVPEGNQDREVGLWATRATFVPGPKQDRDVTLGNHRLFHGTPCMTCRGEMLGGSPQWLSW